LAADIMMCPQGKVPPGRRSPPSFPLLRYSAAIDEPGDTPLGLTWGFRHIHPKGRGYPDSMGISWIDGEGRARGRLLLRLTSGFKGIVIICPPGIDPPPGPYWPSIFQPTRPGEKPADESETSYDAAGESDMDI
jgi:hypothetical protein